MRMFRMIITSWLLMLGKEIKMEERPMLRSWILAAVAALGVALSLTACAGGYLSADACQSNDAALGSVACARGYAH